MAATRVLVVDADPAICSLVEDILGDVGYDVRTSSDFSAALDLVPSWRPHLIVLEPVAYEMDAETFLAACREHQVWETPVILLSGRRELGAEAARLGAQEALEKPFDIDTLCHLVRQFDGRAGASEPCASGRAYAQ